MPVLRNQKRELFCQGIVKGLNQTQAATNAGFSAKSAESSASRLAKDVKVKARIIELRNLIVKVGETGLTTAEMAAQAESIPFVRARVADRQYRLSVLGEVAAKLLAEIRKLKNLRRQKTLLSEFREYLKQACVETGDWTEKQDHTVRPAEPGVDLSRVSLETLLAARQKLLDAELEADRMLMIEAAPGTVEVLRSEPGSGDRDAP